MRTHPTLTATVIALAMIAPTEGAHAQPETLLIQDSYPFGINAWVMELAEHGIYPTEIESLDLGATDLTAYDLVITVSVQDDDYTDALQSKGADLAAFVTGGGVLIWSGSRSDAQGPYPDPPFGASITNDPATTNFNVHPFHPMMVGLPTAVHGTFSSYSTYVSPPADSVVLMNHGTSGTATLYLLREGAGLLIASALNWEDGWYDGSTLGDVLIAAIDHAEAFEPCLGFDDDGDGWTDCQGDCDDVDPAFHPGAEEVCNDGLDHNCDAQDWEYNDDDGDGFANCDGDCDDFEPLAFPGNVEVCDGVDNDCDGLVDDGFDVDGDGWTTCAGDCDDTNPDAHPGQPEDCNGFDDDCDGTTDEPADDDHDGWTVCNGDCNDLDPNVRPGAPELCDGLDNDCDGSPSSYEVDGDGDGHMLCADCDDADPTRYPGAEEICGDLIDSDCLGDLTTTETDNDGDLYSECAGDCDDSDVTVFPGQTEVCNGEKDDDCDPDTDELADTDGDGWTICDGDCNDAEAATFPDNPEICDDLDNDCDGIADDGLDYDLDGWEACDGQDCDDYNGSIHPGATEIPYDNIDQDCDGRDLTDIDGDGYDGGYWGDDCDDLDPQRNPGEIEDCFDGIDADCDGITDQYDADCIEPEEEPEPTCACRAGGEKGTLTTRRLTTAWLLPAVLLVLARRRRG
jgi:hypothetical protein